ncbi:fumarate reductase subunit FrdD [Actinomadura rudentiformis]|uniref:Fumarate reductase subunit D n=1 Tax=Actinomadura rudentiformis TaxID=359158 RepID=A0A6H9Z4Y6_9ACTN|nr:fumarate reductase subunit FrdD [Actinomadura rudentiformis]KAB2352328.1 fumarate reductase subunit D [Actinomadura rudentiformis]
MAKRQIEPILWLTFSAGGMAAALALPVLLLVFGVLIPLDWASPDRTHLLAVLRNPLTRLVLLAVFVLALFHWAHRFRYTLYEGLQLKHLNQVINVLCYGGAVAGSVMAGYILLIAL